MQIRITTDSKEDAKALLADAVRRHVVSDAFISDHAVFDTDMVTGKTDAYIDVSSLEDLVKIVSPEPETTKYSNIRIWVADVTETVISAQPEWDDSEIAQYICKTLGSKIEKEEPYGWFYTHDEATNRWKPYPRLLSWARTKWFWFWYRRGVFKLKPTVGWAP